MAHDETNSYVPANIAARHRLGLPILGKLVLYAGRFAPEHPIDLLLDAAPAVMDRVKLVHFVLVGDGLTRRRLEAICRARALDAAVIFAGDVPPEQLRDYYTACDVGLFLSSSFGCRAAKAFSVDDIFDFMNAGRAVVAAGDVPDARLFVQTNNIGCASAITGRRNDDVGSLQLALVSMLTDDRARIRRGENGRTLARAVGSDRSVLGFLKASIKRAAAL